MSSISISIPDINDADLVFSEAETRQILKFFWPHATGIDGMSIDNEVRRFGQAILIAAVEASYAMGFVKTLFQATVRPGSNIKSLVKKLAKGFGKHWWKHTKQRDLQDAKIYESVRLTIALKLKHQLGMLQEGVALKRGVMQFYAITTGTNAIWA